MPGICGYLNRIPQSDMAALSAEMLERLRSPNCRLSNDYVDTHGRFALGHAALGILSTVSQPISIPGRKLFSVFDGELYDHPQPEKPQPGLPPLLKRDDDAKTLLQNFAEGGADSVSRLEGSFAAAIVDAALNKLYLVSDRFGTRPVYYAHTKDRLAFASSIHSLLADADVSREFDWQGLAQFFTLGHYFNDNTSLAAVKVLPAAAMLEFDGNTNRVTMRRYWSGSARIASPPKSRHDALEAVENALVHSVRRRQLTGSARLGISLSGGLDARTILGIINERECDLTTLCMGMPGSRDHKVSEQLARIIGCPHHNHVLDATFLSRFGQHLSNMVRLTDGQYLSQCIVLPTLPHYQSLGIDILMRGHAGELLHLSKAYNYSLDQTALQLGSESELELWLWGRLKAYIHDGVDGALFARKGFDGTQAARESLRDAIAATPTDERPASRISHLFLDQRVRRETMLSMRKFRSVTEPRLPYLDRTLVETLLAIPCDWRMDDELQSFILQKYRPEFCRVENTNTGAPLGVGVFRRRIAGLRMKVFSKLGVPGYQPYERLGLWLRRELASLVRDTLLDEQCLDRGVFDPDTVRCAVQRHLAGERNHTYFILALMIFEVGHRWLLDDRFGVRGETEPLATAR